MPEQTSGSFRERLLSRQESAWQAGQRILVEELLQEAPQAQLSEQSVEDLIYGEIHLRKERGDTPTLEEYTARFPHLHEKLKRLFEVDAAFDDISLGARPSQPAKESPATQDFVAAGQPPVHGPGTVIAGRYKLLQKIGEGGMGEVWMADQWEPLQRRVAVKLILAEQGNSSRILARFEAERQAIALMDHPHIARLLDAGTSDAGAPFFVMELVKGVPLTEFCDAHRLTIPERLHLFQQICSAVQHAHQKGIIHRDLKPSNILVERHDDQPVPKVIDFGLAKATSGLRLTERTLFSAFGTVAGTPLYMAPEQAHFNAIDIDTRADVYSLGVLLYELLTGTTPITRETAKQAALDELLRLVREQEAPTPSSRLSSSDSQPTVAANRRVEPAKLGRFVKGDLDWIVIKALAKERERRYETASGFARDIQRFLNHEPVQAGPPSVRYRMKKFVRRNRPQVIAAALVLLALLAGMVGTTVGLVRARKAEAVAEQRYREAEAARAKAADAATAAEQAEADTLAAYRASTDDAIQQLIGSKPELGPSEKTYLENALKRWQAFAGRQGTDERTRAIRGEGHFRVAKLWAILGHKEEARAENQLARDIFQKLAEEFPRVPKHKEKLAAASRNLGKQLDHLGQWAEALAEYESARDIQKKLVEQFPAAAEHKRELARTYHGLGTLLKNIGKLDEARTEYLASQDISEELIEQFPTVPEYQRELAGVRHNLGTLLTQLGQFEEARAEYMSARDIQQNLVEEFSAVPLYQRDLAATHANLGNLLRNVGNVDEARAEYQSAHGIVTKLVQKFPAVPEYQQNLGATHTILGRLLRQDRKFDEALAEYQLSYRIVTKLVEQFPAVPEYQRDLAATRMELGLLLADLGKRDDARAEYQAGIELYEKLVESFPTVPKYQIELGGSYCNYGLLSRADGKWDECLQWNELAIRTLQPIHEQDRRDVTVKRSLRSSHANRAFAYGRLKQPAQAVRDLDRAIELSPPAEQPRYRANRATYQFQAGMVAEAVAEIAELTKNRNCSAGEWYNFACIYSVASDNIADKKLEYADRAIELLRQAVNAGYKNAAHLATDTDLDPLRARDDFQQLLAELEPKN